MISGGLDEFLLHTRLEVTNGGMIKFWLDTLCGDENFRSRFSELFNCVVNKEGSYCRL